MTKFSKPFQYADDTALIKPIYLINDINNFQTDLNQLEHWCNERNLKLNPNKSIHLRISFKNVGDLPNYSLNNQQIPKKKFHKHLGFLINDKLNLNEQIENTYNACIRKWALLKKICSYANAKIFLLLYKTYILPILEYCN